MKHIAALLCLVFAACSQGEKTTLTYPNGMRQAEGYMNEIGKNGLWTFWNEQGQLTQQGDFDDGLKVGVWTYWNDEGKKERDGEIKDGEWTYWFSSRISANENATVATLQKTRIQPTQPYNVHLCWQVTYSCASKLHNFTNRLGRFLVS